MTLEPTGNDAQLGNTPASQPSLPGGEDHFEGGADDSGEQSVSLFNTKAAPSSPSEAPAGETTPIVETPAAPAAEPWQAMPKSWKKEMEAHWGTMTPEQRQYVHHREEQAFRGIQQYARGHEAWSKITEPYQEILSQHPDVNPVELMGGLARNHFLLSQGTPQQKRAMLDAMAQHYGIDLGQPAPAAAPSPFTPEQTAMLQKLLGPVVQQTQSYAESVRQGRVAEAQKAVDTFFSDPQYEFSGEVGQDMLDLLKKGRATDLPEAYELAVMRNPEVKAKYLAKLASQANGQPKPAATLNLKSSTTPARQPKPASMDETMDAIVKKHYGSTG
jgi:hypothetical protein